MTPDTDRPRSRRSDRFTILTIVAAVGACSVRCAGPLLAVVGGLGLVLSIGAIWIPVLAIVAAVPLVLKLEVWRRRSSRRRRAAGPVQLGMPSIGTAGNAGPDIPLPEIVTPETCKPSAAGGQ